MKVLIISAIIITIVFLAGYKHIVFHSSRRNLALLLLLYLGVVVLSAIYMIFIINAFQFGMDQLHDSPTEDSILFIHWYVWICRVCSLISGLTWNLLFYDFIYFNYLDSLRISGMCVLGLVGVTILSLLVISLCVVHREKDRFLLEPAGENPYKLVYKVTKFVYHHKVPLRRSAFTYCTEELPSRMDVGKRKFGGPFTTQQVEDVKAFWGILKVVLSIGPAFLFQAVTQSVLPAFAKHDHLYFSIDTGHPRQLHLESVPRHIIISNGLLSPFLVTISIPFYLCFIRPHFRHHIPGALKRMGLAMVVMVMSLICTFVMDAVIHVRDERERCMFEGYVESDFQITHINGSSDTFPEPPLYQNMYFFISQHVLSAVTNMLLDIAVLEFICSQSPYSMKGLLLGIVFSVRSFSQGIALASIIPFGAVWKIHSLSCGSGFYVVNIVLGLAALLMYSHFAQRYKYREVNEPSHEYRYAEDHYSNLPA
jgi:peptide/histidine transporter 3/4